MNSLPQELADCPEVVSLYIMSDLQSLHIHTLTDSYESFDRFVRERIFNRPEILSVECKSLLTWSRTAWGRKVVSPVAAGRKRRHRILQCRRRLLCVRSAPHRDNLPADFPGDYPRLDATVKVNPHGNPLGLFWFTSERFRRGALSFVSKF